MRVLVCGDRRWRDTATVHARLAALKASVGAFTVIEGGASGADRIAFKAARRLQLPVERFPAEWRVHGLWAGPRRNRQMLDSGVDLVLAFHDDLERSRGTLDCVTQARRRGITVDVIRSRPARAR